MASRLYDPVWDGTTTYVQWTLRDRLDTLSDVYSSQRAADRFRARIHQEKDIEFYTAACVNTVNPQLKHNKYLPFLPTLRQVEMLYKIRYCVDNGLDLAIFKSRKIGASWLLEIDDSFDWLTDPGASNVSGSRVKELVDSPGKANMNTLFGKFDYITDNLPRLIRPEGYKDSAPWRVDFMRQNLVNGAQITGEPVTPNFGAGPRAMKGKVDEGSRCEWMKPAWETLGQTAPTRITVFTPYGKNFAWGLAFPDEYMIVSGETQVERPEVFRLHWKDIPINDVNKFYLLSVPLPDFSRRESFEYWWRDNQSNIVAEGNGYSPFDSIGGAKDGDGIPFGVGYDDGRGNISHLQQRMPIRECPRNAVSALYPWRMREGFRYDKAGAARELDCRFEESRKGRVYAVALTNTVKTKIVERSPDAPLYAFCDPGRGVGNAFYLGWLQWHNELKRYQTLCELMYEGRDCYFFIPFLTGRLDHAQKYLPNYPTSDEDREFFEIMRHASWRINMLYGDPHGVGSQTAGQADTIAGIFREHGIPTSYDFAHAAFSRRIDDTRRVLTYTELSLEGTPKLNMALSGIAFPEVSENTKQTTPGTGGWVHHPIFSHPVSAFEYFSCADPHRYDFGEYEEDAPEQRMIRLYDRDGEVEKQIKAFNRRKSFGGRFRGQRSGY